jgi:hypothetical protein
VATNAIALTKFSPIPHLRNDPGDVSWNYCINIANVRPLWNKLGLCLGRYHQAAEVCRGLGGGVCAAWSCRGLRMGTKRPDSLWSEGASQYIESGSTRIGGLFSYVQKPQSTKQLNKPKLQLRIPSAPISRFLAFLLPPTCIGAVPCKENKYDMTDMVITVVGV